MNAVLSEAPSLVVQTRQYSLELARTPAEVEEAQRLRFEVFNLELKEGLECSYRTGLDGDRFDPVCDHLLVRFRATDKVIGTYRLQTGARALSQAGKGYYCQDEFDFSPYRRLAPELIELGRACVHEEHRTLGVLGLLWKGIGIYALRNQARYLIGCSSITSQDPAEGMALFHSLWNKHAAPLELQTTPHPDFTCESGTRLPASGRPPRLLRAYLELGAWICGPPALDRAFGTIDYLTLLDLETLSRTARERFLQA